MSDIHVNKIEEPNPPSGRLPFNLFNEEMGTEQVLDLLANYNSSLPIDLDISEFPNEFNVYKPEVQFEKVYRQALGTTHDLLGITREEYLKLPNHEKQNHVRIYSLFHHVISTPLISVIGSEERIELDTIKIFFRYFFKELIRRYYGDPINFEMINKKELLNQFVLYILVHIENTGILNNPNWKIENWIDLYIYENEKKMVEYDIQKFRQDFDSHILLSQELLSTSEDYKLSVFIQTLIWYVMGFMKPSKLQEFKSGRLNLNKLIDNFSESVYEMQKTIKTSKPIEP